VEALRASAREETLRLPKKVIVEFSCGSCDDIGRQPGDCGIARWKETPFSPPKAVIWCIMLPPPADSPMRVI